MARIEFSRGVTEDTIPGVKLTRSRTGQTSTATFYFESPQAIQEDYTEEITGMYMVDEEGELVTREVKGKFINGKAHALEAIYTMKSPEEWDRFMRFMNRYAQANGLEFSKS